MKRLIIILLLAACQKEKDEPIVQPIDFDLTGQWIADTTEYSIGITVIKYRSTNTAYVTDYTWTRHENTGYINQKNRNVLKVDIIEPTKIFIDNKPYTKR